MPSISVTVIRTAANQAAVGNQTTQISLNELPNECPVCHVTIEPENLTGAQSAIAFDWTEVYLRCTNMRCRRHFTALYRLDRGASQHTQTQVFRLEQCVPFAPVLPKFDAEIAQLSPSFIEVYAQSSAAEGYGLTEVAGPGFRKALEFLVKDYAIYLNPQQAEAIKQRQLASVIRELLPGDKLPVVSARATWLGNDQTHYESRWVGKDLQDLKRLIDATAHFIAMERLVAGLPVDMPATGPSTPSQNP